MTVVCLSLIYGGSIAALLECRYVVCLYQFIPCIIAEPVKLHNYSSNVVFCNIVEG
jgi:hypothetical protein